jgi:hypothetical protein
MRPREAALALGLVALLALLLVALGGGGSRERGVSAPPPSPPVVQGPPRGAPAAPDAQIAQARLVARRFLARYVPFLYGRGRAERIPHVSGTVRRGLTRARARETPVSRTRRPRIGGLSLTAQARRSLIARADVDDGGVTPYPLTFTLIRRGGRWIVNALGSD